MKIIPIILMMLSLQAIADNAGRIKGPGEMEMKEYWASGGFVVERPTNPDAIRYDAYQRLIGQDFVIRSYAIPDSGPVARDYCMVADTRGNPYGDVHDETPVKYIECPLSEVDDTMVWKLDKEGRIFLTEHPDQCLDVPRYAVWELANPLWTHGCHFGENQKFHFERSRALATRLYVTASGAAVSVAGSDVKNWQPIITWWPDGSRNQSWRAYPVKKKADGSGWEWQHAQ